jgi:hypothetical protein
MVADLKAERNYQSQNITTHLVRAAMMGDWAGVQPWMQEANRFAINNPGIYGPLQQFDRLLNRSEQGEAMSQAFGTPTNLKSYDPIGGLIKF